MVLLCTSGTPEIFFSCFLYIAPFTASPSDPGCHGQPTGSDIYASQMFFLLSLTVYVIVNYGSAVVIHITNPPFSLRDTY